MNIKVRGKEYKIEFTFESIYCKPCVKAAWEMFSGFKIGMSQSKKDVVLNTLESLIDTPETALTFLYGGLLEHHGDEIKTEKDAKELYKQFCKENPDDKLCSPLELVKALREQMEEDRFFEKIGVKETMEIAQAEAKKDKK